MFENPHDDWLWKLLQITIVCFYSSLPFFSAGFFHTFDLFGMDITLIAKACLWLLAFVMLGFLAGFNVGYCCFSEPAEFRSPLCCYAMHPEHLPAKYIEPRLGVHLSVRFINGSYEEQELVKTVVGKHYHDIDMPIRFVLDESGLNTSPVRVLFTTSGVSKSQVGFWSRSNDPREPTMTLNLTSLSFEEKQATILHQFGHALGFQHLHAYPESEVEREDAENWVRGRDWLCFNCIRRSNTTLSVPGLKTFEDTKSIMYHPADAPKTDSTAVSIPINTVLSEGDKQRLKSLYPSSVSFSLGPGVVVSPY